MPVTTAEKVQALSRDFGSQRRLAELLGVSPAQVTRWRRGQGIDELNAERVDLLELVMSNLLRAVPDRGRRALAARAQPEPGRPPAARPDPARAGARAARRDRHRAGRQLRVILWRVLPWDPSARPAAPGGALWFPRPFQGTARHDNPARYGCLYVDGGAGLGDRGGARAVPRHRRPAAGDAHPHGPPARAGASSSCAARELLDLDDPAVLARGGRCARRRWRRTAARRHAARGRAAVRRAPGGRRPALVVDARGELDQRDAVRPRGGSRCTSAASGRSSRPPRTSARRRVPRAPRGSALRLRRARRPRPAHGSSAR